MQNETTNQEQESKAPVTEEVMVEAEKVEEKKIEIDYKSKFLYLAAEMENLRKRADRERDEFLKYGNEKILKGLLEVVDNFERTVDALKGDEDSKIKNIVTGIDMVGKQFIKVLEKFGLEQVKALGEEFDPNLHEALSQMPAEGKKDDEIIQVYEKGYKLNGRLIRPAKVIVAKN
ncbi:MAG: nucleotide exchange factor GrpE [Bacteriovoracaceae bacterium]|nr:nucleotide exchange factor GrpE [Bacteriovoracaceae bacterium]